MGFHISTSEVPTLGTYRIAKYHHDSVTPIKGRGRNAGVRPLANRRAAHMTLRWEGKVTSPSGAVCDAVICRLYRTDCVTFYESGEVRINNGNYTTFSTRLFVNAVLHSRQRVSSIVGDRSLYSIYHQDPNGETTARLLEKEQEFMFSGFIDLKPDGLPLHPETCVVHRVDRKALNSVRKLYAPFIRYATAMIKIGYAANVGLNRDIRDQHVEDIKDTGIEDWPGSISSQLFTYDNADFLCRVMRHNNKEDWANALHAMATVTMVPEYRHGFNELRYFYRPDHMLHALKEAPKYAHRDQVFVCKELPMGEYKQDLNMKYMDSL